MVDISRDSFRETQNSLIDIRGLVPAPQVAPRHYVSLRLQQGVPVLDADWNERDDVRRLELEAVLARAIGTGVPAGSDGFRITEGGVSGDFLIEAGLLFLDGWLVWAPASVRYSQQPHRASPLLAPVLPVPLPVAAVVRRELVYLDAWERVVDSSEDQRMVDHRIGLETCVRIQREWIVRSQVIQAAADPLDPAAITDRQPGHRYYPLATFDRPIGNTITNSMIADLRRTHLTLDTATHAPLFIDDAARGQRLDSARLAGAFRGNLNALRDILQLKPEIFVYAGHEAETWQAMTALQDVRSLATVFEQQARAKQLHRKAALQAAQAFFEVQAAMIARLSAFVTSGIVGTAANSFLDHYRTRILGTVAGDPRPMQPALGAGDLLGAILAQERLNEALGLESDALPEGSLTASMRAVIPSGNVVAGTTYQLTIRINSLLFSAQGQESIRVIAAAGSGWTLSFQGSTQPSLREHVVQITNQASADVVLFITAATGASNTSLSLNVRPERRQQLVYHHPPVALAIGSQIIPGGVVSATLAYEGPALAPGNSAQVSKAVMLGGVALPFRVTNVSSTAQEYQVTVTPQTATGWQAPAQPVLASLNAGANRPINITFRIADAATAVTPQTYRVQLTRVTGGASEALPSTAFDLTFALT